MIRLFRLRFLVGLLICFGIPSHSFAQSFPDRLEVGSWFGRAIPDDPSTSPFTEVVMTPTFFADGTLIANDAHEFTNVHGTSHGHWKPTGPQTIHSTFIWLSLSAEKANGFTGMVKVRLFGRIDPSNPDRMIGKVYPVFFPEGTDALTANDADGIPLGVFTIEQLRRIKVDPTKATVTGVNLSSASATGMWFGRALPNNPTTAAFSELFVEPTFMADGNVIFNSSQEERAVISASHGQWTMDGTTVKSTFLWMGMSTTGTSGFTGATKVRFTGQVSPTNANEMTGSFSLVTFPPTADPLDPNDVGGTPAGTYTIQLLQRLRVGPTGQRDVSKHIAVGTWVGRAVPDDPAQSPFPEVYMTPTFMTDGNMIANDAIANSLHHTAHGDWFSTETNGAETTFLFILGTPEATNGFGGAFKIRLVGEINPSNPDVMVGKLFPTLYPPNVNPLDPNAQGQPIVSLSYQLRRVPIQQQVPAFQPSAAELDRRVHVVTTVTQNDQPAAGLQVAFARSISGLPLNYAWQGTTDANGRVTVKIEVDATQFGRSGATGYYSVRATNSAGAVVSTWNSVPINGGSEVRLALPVGDKAQVTEQIDLENLGVFTLIGNTPNPFNPATQIAYKLNAGSDVRLVIFNSMGQEVRELVNGFQPAGNYRIVWDGKDAAGHLAASGMYIYRLSSGDVSQTRQMLLLK